MLTIKNMTNSPYPVVLADGSRTMLPARGTLENVDVHPQHLQLYRSIGYFQISEAEAGPKDPLDHDGDGKKGRSLPADASEAEIQRLRSEYTDLTGKKPRHLWKQERLQAEIDKTLEA